MAKKKQRPMRKPVSSTPAWVGPALTAGGLAVVVGIFLLVRWANTPPAPQPLKPDAAQAVVATITSLTSSELEGIGQGLSLIHI